jgi:hypothetical protein
MLMALSVGLIRICDWVHAINVLLNSILELWYNKGPGWLNHEIIWDGWTMKLFRTFVDK